MEMKAGREGHYGRRLGSTVAGSAACRETGRHVHRPHGQTNFSVDVYRSPNVADRRARRRLLASLVMGGTGYGLIGDIIIGIVGAFCGGWILGPSGTSVRSADSAA